MKCLISFREQYNVHQAGTMKVLFVCPKSFNPKQTYREYPLGVGYLATVLQRLGHEAAIFDQSVEGADDALLCAPLAVLCS